MKIGIIIHTQTGNTYIVAQKLQERLSAAGHLVNIEKVTQKSSKPTDMKNVQLVEKPEADKYDVLIFGAPVWGFSLSAVMAAYLTQMPSLKNKKAVCFVTKFLPFSWTGGYRAINQMRKIVKSKNASVCGTEIITQKSIKNNNRLKDVIESLSKYAAN
jgi:NAD(P)H dehydrogenase (quinone)